MHLIGLGTRLLDHMVSLSVHDALGPAAPPKPLAHVLKALTCEADAVFSGFVSQAASFPTENGELLFTDYQVTVGDVFSSRNESELAAASTTVVTQVGGAMELEGGTISTTLPGYPDLKPSREYVFFGRLLPRTKTYHLATPGQVWEVQAGRVKALARAGVSDVDVFKAGADLNIVAGHLRTVRCE